VTPGTGALPEECFFVSQLKGGHSSGECLPVLLSLPLGLSFVDEGVHALFLVFGGEEHIKEPPLVGQGSGYFHDNRAACLEEVFTKYKHKVGNGLAPADLADLLQFLRSL
jgi:hypothetical protein